jgi:hypothetical protein
MFVPFFVGAVKWLLLLLGLVDLVKSQEKGQGWGDGKVQRLFL